MSDKIPAGAKCLSPAETHKKFAREKSWLWDKVKNDPEFPRPVYIGSRPVFLEHELDAWLARQPRMTSTERGLHKRRRH